MKEQPLDVLRDCRQVLIVVRANVAHLIERIDRVVGSSQSAVGSWKNPVAEESAKAEPADLADDCRQVLLGTPRREGAKGE